MLATTNRSHSLTLSTTSLWSESYFLTSLLQHCRPGKSISEAIEQVPPAEIKKRFDLDNRLSNCYTAWTTKHTGCGVTTWSRAPVLSSGAPGNCKASRPPGCFFIKGWNERSHVADPHITSSCWRPRDASLFTGRAFFDGLAMKVFFISPSKGSWNALLPANPNFVVDRSVRSMPCLSQPFNYCFLMCAWGIFQGFVVG